MGADSVPFQLAEHDRRLGGIHKRLGEVQVKQADQDKAIVGLLHDVKNIDGDVGDLKLSVDQRFEKFEKALEVSDQRREAGEEKTRKALYTAAVTLAGLALSLLGVIATFLGHA